MKRYIILVLLSICIVGCAFNQNKSVDKQILYELNKKYEKIKEFFGREMVNHFPEKVDSTNITFTEGLSPDLGNLEFISINKIGDKLPETIKYFQNKAIAIYNANDSCLLIVNRFANRNNYYKIKLSKSDFKLIDLNCYRNKFPVPNFWHNDFTTEKTYCRLPKDFKLYVLEAKSGQFFDKKYLTDGQFMPNEWKNGYSKGVAISKKRNVIIYWVIVW